MGTLYCFVLPGGRLNESTVRQVFLGSDGIRPGWGVLFFVLMVVGFEFLAFALLRSQLPAGRPPAVLPLRLALLTECAQLFPVMVSTAIMARVERKPVLSYGYQGRSRVLYLVSGLACGFAAFSALVFVLKTAGLLVFEGEQLHGEAIWSYALGWALMFLMAAAFEESALRGYLQFTLKRGFGFWWAALLLSVVFGLAHLVNAGEDPVGIVGIIAVGLMFCLSLWYTGSLWWAVGCHASWDWAESYFYGASDSGVSIKGHLFGVHPIGPPLWSGGTAGPEGSLLNFFVPALLSLGMWLWWGRRGSL
jgi:membrane protease YdiL (CAAX protease family)